MINSRILLAILLSLGAAVPAGAADRERTVKFKPGTTSASYKDKTQGYDMVSYDLDARAGQTLAIRFKASLGSCDFAVQRPDGQAISPTAMPYPIPSPRRWKTPAVTASTSS